MTSDKQCAHCGEMVAYSRVTVHEKLCIADPVITEAVKTLLHENAILGAIGSEDAYNRAAKGCELRLPTSLTLKKMLATDWAGVAAWAGLSTDADAARLDYSRQHLRALADELHGGEYGPSLGEWAIHKDSHAFSHLVLRQRLGAASWAEVLEWAGLRLAEKWYYIRAGRKRASALDDDEVVQLATQRNNDYGDGLAYSAVTRKVIYNPHRFRYETVTAYLLK